MLAALAPLQLVLGIELWLFLVLVLLLPLIVFIAIAVWLYQDANSRGMEGGLWVVVLILAGFTFIGGILVLIVYLIVRESHPIGGRPYGYGVPPGYPPAYGPPYAPAYPGYPPAYPGPPAAGAPPAAAAPPATATAGKCPRCGAANHPGARFCSSCGSAL